MFFCGGACPADCLLTPPLWCPQGGLGGFSCLPTLPLVCFVAPIPPTPFPAGRGRFLVYFAGGFAPGTPALDRLRHLQNLPSRCPAGGLPSLSPPYPAFSLLSCPLFPRPPSPVGKGEIFSFLMQGASPLASLRAEPMVRRKTDRKRFPASGTRRQKFAVRRDTDRRSFPMGSAVSQGEGGPGERNFGV